jgi:uncharacterized membrane protein YjjP (DUF1212 family)
MQTDVVPALRLAVEAGVTMLRAGGEISRVEDTIGHIAGAYGARRVDAYATPTGLFVTGEGEDGISHTVIRRVPGISNDLSVVAAVNDLSRRAARQAIPLADAWEELRRIIDAPPPYPIPFVLAAALIASGTSSLLFGGNIVDMLGAGVAGLAVQGTVIAVDRFGWGAFTRSWAGGFLAAGIATLMHFLVPAISVHYTVAGAIMPLVPGIAITNALRDIMGGELVSGVTRSVEAAAIAIGVAAGVGLVLGFGGS